MDLARLRVCTARCFLDGFAQIREMQGHVSLPIFAAMSPIDMVLAAESNALLRAPFWVPSCKVLTDVRIHNAKIKGLCQRELQAFSCLILSCNLILSAIKALLCCMQACDYGKLKDFLGAVKSKDVTLLTVEGARHEVLMSPEREHVLQSIIAWLTR